jgi:hypothetical protein
LNKRYTIISVVTLVVAVVASIALILVPISGKASKIPTDINDNSKPTGITVDQHSGGDGIVLSDFQKGHGFRKQIAAGNQLDDTSNFLIGNQSLRLTTDGDRTAIFTRESNISPAIDFGDKPLRLWLKVNDTSKLRELRIVVTGDWFETNRDYWIEGNGFDSTGILKEGWNLITLDPIRMKDSGSPDMSKIDTIQIRVADKGTGSVTVWFNSLSLMS